MRIKYKLFWAIWIGYLLVFVANFIAAVCGFLSGATLLPLVNAAFAGWGAYELRRGLQARAEVIGAAGPRRR